MQAKRRHVFIAGCGYVGQRLALRLQAHYDVTGLVRSASWSAPACGRSPSTSIACAPA
jgi:nucleoside-diphosphate-sugar epimerase